MCCSWLPRTFQRLGFVSFGIPVLLLIYCSHSVRWRSLNWPDRSVQKSLTHLEPEMLQSSARCLPVPGTAKSWMQVPANPPAHIHLPPLKISTQDATSFPACHQLPNLLCFVLLVWNKYLLELECCKTYSSTFSPTLSTKSFHYLCWSYADPLLLFSCCFFLLFEGPTRLFGPGCISAKGCSAGRQGKRIDHWWNTWQSHQTWSKITVWLEGVRKKEEIKKKHS